MEQYLRAAHTAVSIRETDGTYTVYSPGPAGEIWPYQRLMSLRWAAHVALRLRAETAAELWYADREGAEDGTHWLLRETAGEMVDAGVPWRRAARLAIDWWRTDGAIAIRQLYAADDQDNGVLL